ncbi:ferredoxin [Clostridium sp. HCP1S3_B4]|uniref:ferredoxin n=1 Tax=unclassified Clostridium TaxID=2614128 RepID=UPI0016A24C25|nr:ferredoxin [Clostridiales bacterium]MDY2729870.1 ferredoxin [Clostridium sp.]NLK24689.1 ferredoxin [Clostridiales bacterium]
MKANVDQDTCISCGLCPTICDKVFQMGDSGKAEVIVSEVPSDCEDDVKDAEASCPVNAISAH